MYILCNLHVYCVQTGDNELVVTLIHYSQWPEHSAPTCGNTVLQLNDTVLKTAMHVRE